MPSYNLCKVNHTYVLEIAVQFFFFTFLLQCVSPDNLDKINTVIKLTIYVSV